jgi:hypothetical protein
MVSVFSVLRFSNSWNLFFISSLNSCRIFGSCNLPTSIFSLIDERKVMNNKICQTHSERIKEKLRTKYTECNKKVKTATRKNMRDFMQEKQKVQLQIREWDRYTNILLFITFLSSINFQVSGVIHSLCTCLLNSSTFSLTSM